MEVKCLAQGHINTQVNRTWDGTADPLIGGVRAPQSSRHLKSINHNKVNLVNLIQRRP